MAARSGPIGIGVIGAGVISGTYLENLASFPDTEVLAIGDLLPDVADKKAAEYGIALSGGSDVVLNHPDVELVVNLTTPDAHAEVAHQAIAAGKHVWNEKPLSLDRESARAMLDAAEAAGVRVGCAPDTFLGSGLQRTRQLIESGIIGRPLSALFLMQQPGPDLWHPNPAFLFQYGAGPLFDIGPYYFTALVQLFGPAASVSAIGSKAQDVRKIHDGPKAGETFDVTVPSQMTSLTRFESGQSLSLVLSFDSALPRILLEITGTEGTLEIPDPNMFQGDIRVRRIGDEEWTLVETTAEKSQRGTGALDMARAIRDDRPHRAQGTQAFHVLDIMVSTAESAESGQVVEITSTTTLPELLPENWDPKAATL